MRANDVCMLAVWCGGRGCNHHRVIDVSYYPDDVPVSFGPRMVCTVCGAEFFIFLLYYVTKLT